MINFIDNPNLPKGRVKSVICGELCSELNSYFDSVGIIRYVIEQNSYVDSAVKYHADMAALHLGSDIVLLDKNQNALGEKLISYGFSVHYSKTPVAGEYPHDISLNFTVFGNNIMGKLPFADENLFQLADKFNKIEVKQGYCKCSCLIINENAVITDDESIYRTLKKRSIDVLLISKGDISLEGHEYGFIGGASGKISNKEVIFFGDITKHRDYKKIADFIEKYSCKIISLDFPLTDFGGIIPLTEEI